MPATRVRTVGVVIFHQRLGGSIYTLDGLVELLAEGAVHPAGTGDETRCDYGRVRER